MKNIFININIGVFFALLASVIALIASVIYQKEFDNLITGLIFACVFFWG